MNTRCAISRWAPALCVALAAPVACAQSMYRCATASGSYLSDRPCDTGAQSVLKAYGPLPERPSYAQNASPTLRKAPDILPYLSPECAEMNDAVRTGPSRGLKGESMAELATNYRLRCSEDEQLAHKKLNQARSDERHQRDQTRAAQQQENERAKLSIAQCSEMLGTLASRRQRAASMGPGERHDLELFEASYKARCKP